MKICKMSTAQQPYSSTEGWKPAAQSYGSNVGRTSAHAAQRLISFASERAPINASSKILDVGAGAGAVTVHVLTSTEAHVTASDLHQSMLDSIQAPPGAKLVRQAADARSLTKVFEKESFSHVFCTYMLQTITTPVDALREMHQLLQPSIGVVGIACWDQQNDPFDIWEKACQTIDPLYKLPIPFDDPHAWRTEEEVAKGLKEAGFKDVATERLTSPFPFDGTQKFMDFWFVQGNPAALRCMSNWQGSMEEAKKAVEKVCREQYDDGHAICTKAVLGVGRV